MTSVFPAPDALSPAYRAALRGSLFGTALGDALGYRVETLSRTEMLERWSVAGETDLLEALAGGDLAVSDDTQLTLATLDGLTEVLEWNNEGQAADELACIWLSYLRWYTGTGHTAPEAAPYSLPRPLNSQAIMRQKRGPGKATLNALATGQMQFISKNVNPDALGTGALMRSAPFGYLPVADDATVIKLAVQAAALTHGHTEALVSAAAYALMIRYLLGAHELAVPVDSPVRLALKEVKNWLGTVEKSSLLPGDATLTRAAFGRALELADRQSPAHEARKSFGALVLATDCLGYGLYLLLATESLVSQGMKPSQALLQTLADAVAVDGDSDSIAALVGSLVGARWSDAVLPAKLLEGLDARAALELVEKAWFTQLGI
ncbi:ADP-ribosylglycohydrolase family protein [Rothia sp. P5764]|uniref:ADP-ribosylglycohydrolase family protein n=1 Tax=Rothia sp. P5764 TaxID=3402654 RepID=UPI003AD6D714